MTTPGHLDAIVVGSGFGGAVAGARLAQAGLTVAILERGRRWPRGTFPRNDRELDDDWVWGKRGGLYDIRWLDRMLSVQGAGWGGGSLVYANVFARPADETFRPHWPASYTRETLDPYFDLVAHMLDVRPVGTDPATGRVPLRTSAMEDLVGRLDLSSSIIRPNLAVQFAENGVDPYRPVLNRHGMEQRACTFTGECVIGCNQGAKNSLDYNYLAVAESAGVIGLTGAEVVGIEPRELGGYHVRVQKHAHASEHFDGAVGEMRLSADAVFLAAGAIGTTELLLRARDVLGTLPLLSDQLGAGFSGNGDFLSLVSRSRTPLQPEQGPTITTTTVVDFTEAGRQIWFQVQDGAYPAVLSRLVANLTARLTPVRALRRERGIRSAAMALLLMGRDASAGRLALDHKGEAAVVWDNRANARLYRAEALVGRVVARMLGGRASPAPTWTWLRRAVTVHNLGGVPMGDDVRSGVIDEHGQVYGYPGLFVIDGAAVPSATGVNPSASIAAMAERNVERAIRRVTGDPTWTAPETADVVPKQVPEDEAMARMADRRRERSGDGIVFHERMDGFLQGTDGTRSFTQLDLDASVSGWTAFLGDPKHAVRVEGTLHIEGLATHRHIHGTLHLFPEDDSAAMRYHFSTRDDRGRPLIVEGSKQQQRGNLFAVWHDLTTLSVEARHSYGQLHISPIGVLRLLASVRGDAFTKRKRLAAIVRFLSFFTAAMIRGLRG